MLIPKNKIDLLTQFSNSPCNQVFILLGLKGHFSLALLLDWLLIQTVSYNFKLTDKIAFCVMLLPSNKKPLILHLGSNQNGQTHTFTESPSWYIFPVQQWMKTDLHHTVSAKFLQGFRFVKYSMLTIINCLAMCVHTPQSRLLNVPACD